jgi:hypothetical protein
MEEERMRQERCGEWTSDLIDHRSSLRCTLVSHCFYRGGFAAHTVTLAQLCHGSRLMHSRSENYSIHGCPHEDAMDDIDCECASDRCKKFPEPNLLKRLHRDCIFAANVRVPQLVVLGANRTRTVYIIGAEMLHVRLPSWDHRAGLWLVVHHIDQHRLVGMDGLKLFVLLHIRAQLRP